MLWEAKDKLCKTMEVAGKKILEISDGWYIDSIICPDNKNGKDINSLMLTVRKDTSEAQTCETCKYRGGFAFRCEYCSRNWEDQYEEG